MYILIVIHLQGSDKEKLRCSAPDYRFVFRDDIRDCTDTDYEEAEILFGHIPPSEAAKFQHAKWVQLCSAGYDHFQGVALPPGMQLTNASGAYGPNISEYMIGSVLAMLQNLHRLRDNQRRRQWKDEGLSANIWGATCIVVGAGDIGQSFAEKLKKLGAARVIGFRKDLSNCPPCFDEMHALNALDIYLPQGDIVSASLPSSSETKNLFDKKMIARFKKGSVFINVGRGTAVDLDALCEALEEGRLRAATLDVTEPEPLPSEHRAWLVDNLILTPHISGGFRQDLNPTSDNCISLKNILTLFIENLERYQKRETLKNIVLS